MIKTYKHHDHFGFKVVVNWGDTGIPRSGLMAFLFGYCNIPDAITRTWAPIIIENEPNPFLFSQEYCNKFQDILNQIPDLVKDFRKVELAEKYPFIFGGVINNPIFLASTFFLTMYMAVKIAF